MFQESASLSPNLRDAIKVAQVEGEDVAQLRTKMLAKFNDLSASESDIFKRYRRASIMNDVMTAAMIVTGAAMTLSAALPLSTVTLGSLALEPKHITGLFGVALCAMLVFDKTMAFSRKMDHYADMSNRVKSLCDRLALLVRNEEDFVKVLDDSNSLLEIGEARGLGWA